MALIKTRVKDIEPFRIELKCYFYYLRASENRPQKSSLSNRRRRSKRAKILNETLLNPIAVTVTKHEKIGRIRSGEYTWESFVKINFTNGEKKWRERATNKQTRTSERKRWRDEDKRKRTLERAANNCARSADES